MAIPGPLRGLFLIIHITMGSYWCSMLVGFYFSQYFIQNSYCFVPIQSLFMPSNMTFQSHLDRFEYCLAILDQFDWIKCFNPILFYHLREHLGLFEDIWHSHLSLIFVLKDSNLLYLLLSIETRSETLVV